MTELRAFQNELYAALCQSGENRCFLRLCADDRALWVTDLPRRQPDPRKVLAALQKLPVTCEKDEAAGLWRLDFTAEEWQRRLDALSDAAPPLPQDEALHGAYALCRLLLLHPAPFKAQPMDMIRAVVKATAGPREKLLAFVPAWHGAAATLVRQRMPLPSHAGRVLAVWIAEQDAAFGKEKRA